MVSMRTVDAKALWVSRYALYQVITNPKFHPKDKD